MPYKKLLKAQLTMFKKSSKKILMEDLILIFCFSRIHSFTHDYKCVYKSGDQQILLRSM